MPGAIGISTAEAGRYALFYAALQGVHRPTDTIMITACSSNIAKNRNDITGAALAGGAEWVLYLDDDHILPQTILTQLLAAEKDVVSALYTQRQPPFNPVLMTTELANRSYVQKQLGAQEQGIVQVAAAGAGCLLVRRRVLEALTPPYWTLGQINPASWGDDLDFCSRVRQAGFEIYCDLSAPIGHFMTGVVWPTYHPTKGWTAQFGQDPQKGAIASWLMPLAGDL